MNNKSRQARGTRTRTMAAAVAALLCGMFSFGVIALSGVPSGAVTTATLFVDNVNGTATSGCTASGTSACKTIQEGVTAAEALSNTAVTLNVAGSSTTYAETATSGVTITVPSGDSLDIEGTGSTQPTLDNGGAKSNVIIMHSSVGAVTIDHMTISGGNGDGNTGVNPSGGGIDDLGSGSLTVGSDTFSNNTSGSGDGGAIDSADGCEGGSTEDLIVTNSTFTGNSVPSSDGGAIAHADCGGQGALSVTGSTFQNNTSGDGGAILANNNAPTNSVTNDTFAANTTTNSGSGAFFGTGKLVDDTFVANTGGGVFNNVAKGSLSIANSILDDAPAGADCASAVTDGGYNVASDASCALGSTSLQSSTTIGTLALAANGSTGPQTAAITSSSSAYQLVPQSACTVTTDERGLMRPGYGKSICDAGAYEFQKSTGYDLAGSDGGVFVFPVGQPKGFFGSLPGLGITVHNVVGLVPTNNFNGYDLAGSDGGVFVFPLGMGSGFYGSLPGLGVKVSNVVGLVGTNSNHGYNLVGSDGGVFVFPTGQSAGFYGSLPGLNVHTNNIVGIVEQPDGKGYLLVGRDGGVFTFGDATFYGSLPGQGTSVNNIIGIATTPTGKGYYLVGSNGAVYPFGDAVSHGSLPAMGVNVSNIVSVVPTGDGGGYWLIGSDGGVFGFGDAGFIGSLPGLNVNVSNVVGAVPTAF